MALPIQVRAEEISITPQMVEEYFDTITKLYTSESLDRDAIIAFTEKHVDDEIVVETTYNIENQPKPMLLKISKAEILESLRSDKNKTMNSKMSFTITGFELDETGQTVNVENTIGWKSVIRGPDKKGYIVDTPTHSLSVCNDRFKLREGILKKIKSRCEISMSTKKPVPVE